MSPLLPSPSSPLPSSPSSSTSHPPTPRYPLPLTQAYLVDEPRPETFHLVPCTADQYFELPFGNEAKFELVDGCLWWEGEMVTHSHDETRDRIAAEISPHHRGHGYDVVVERTVDASKPSDSGGIRSRLRSSSKSTRHRTYTIRRPDIAVFERGRAPNRDNLSPQSKKFSFPRDYPPLLAIEITSPSNRDVDLESKWDEYERAGVQCYVIVDRADEENPSVVVGMLSNGKYRKSVYRGRDVVRGLLLDELGFSAEYLIDPPRSITEIQDSPIKKMDRALRDKDRTISEQSRDLRDKDRTISEHRRDLRDKDRTINEQSRDLRDKDRALRDKDRTIEDQGSRLKDLERALRDMEQRFATQTEQKKSRSKSDRRSEKQVGSSSGERSSASKVRSPPKGTSPTKSPDKKKSKQKK